jgi:putative adhesin
MTRFHAGAAALACSCLLLLTGRAALAERGTAPGRHVLEGSEVSIYNIAGEMHVVEGTERDVVVEVTPGGPDGGRLTVEETTEKGHPALLVHYPEDHIVYHEFGFGPPVGVTSSSLDYDGHRVHVSGRGPGMEAHADIRVLVPRDKTVHLHLAVGRGFITGVAGDLSFEGASSSFQAERVSGGLAVEIGSGNIEISRSQAKIAAETGSGDISISEVDGNLSANAGSGNIDLKRVGAEKISLDAGSGSINGSDIRATSMSADCGSGEIDLDGTSAGKMALEAGSGSVHLRLARNVDELAIQAGSGSVRVEAPENLSARVQIECPKRNLHIQFPMESRRVDDDMTVGTIGSGRGSIHIEAGSGSVDLSRI